MCTERTGFDAMLSTQFIQTRLYSTETLEPPRSDLAEQALAGNSNTHPRAARSHCAIRRAPDFIPGRILSALAPVVQRQRGGLAHTSLLVTKNRARFPPLSTTALRQES